GNELFVLEGGQNTIRKMRPIIYIELYNPWCEEVGYSANDVLKKLSAWGYRCFSLKEGIFREQRKIAKKEETYNYFFLHAERHKKLIGELKDRSYFSR